MDGELRDVMLGWLLNWCNCPDKGLNGSQRARVEVARAAAGEGAGALFGATRHDLERALDEALAEFPELCPDVPEERRLRVAARLARVLEGDRLRHLLGGPVYTAPPARARRSMWAEDDEVVPEQADAEDEDLEDEDLEDEDLEDEDLEDEGGEMEAAEPVEAADEGVEASAGAHAAPGPAEGAAPRHLAADATSWGPLWGPEPATGGEEERSPGPRPDVTSDIG